MIRRPPRWIPVVLLLACGQPAAPQTATPSPPTDPPVTAVAQVPDPTPEPAPAVTGLGGVGTPVPDEAHVCTRNEDCVLVGGPCGAVAAANREHAVQVQHDVDALARVGECAQVTPAAPVEPLCSASVCITWPAPYADAVACVRDRDCEAIALTCHWVVASRTAPGYARMQEMAAAALEGPEPPCVTPAPPGVACRYGFCSDAAALVPLPHGHR